MNNRNNNEQNNAPPPRKNLLLLQVEGDASECLSNKIEANKRVARVRSRSQLHLYTKLKFLILNTSK